MKQLLFATGNAHKISEIQALVDSQFSILSLKDIGFTGELNEPFFTLEENAKTKAEQLFTLFNINCFAEDSGLFVNALKGKPGVFSARYSGPNANDQQNIDFLLQNLKDKTNRTAYFKTVVHLIINNTHHTFTGVCEGIITLEPRGDHGFGYDPIFIPNDLPSKTFAEISKEDKNKISHRAKATQLLIEFLNQQNF